MATFHLQIVTPDGQIFDGQAESVTVPTIDGAVTILARHIDYLSALGMGEAKIERDGQMRRGACIGGMVSVTQGEVKVVATTVEWAEEIDQERAERALAKAKEALTHRDTMTEQELILAEAKLKRALVRTSIAKLR